jgi:hypothetical protein
VAPVRLVDLAGAALLVAVPVLELADKVIAVAPDFLLVAQLITDLVAVVVLAAVVVALVVIPVVMEEPGLVLVLPAQVWLAAVAAQEQTKRVVQEVRLLAVVDPYQVVPLTQEAEAVDLSMVAPVLAVPVL